MTPRNFFVGRGIGFLVVLILLGLFAVVNWGSKMGSSGKEISYTDSHTNTAYTIEGTRVTLVDGAAETGDSDSATKTITEYFGNEVKTDLNNDGREDIVFILTQQPGGSGTFYYVVAALASDKGYVGSEGFLLGDRIAPQTTEKGEGNAIVVNYADRASGEPFTVKPSVGKTLTLSFDSGSMRFVPVEGMTTSLEGKTWTLVSASYADGRSLSPQNGKTYTLTFGSDNTFSSKTDCNSVGGVYNKNAKDISFSQIFMTKMFCEGSREADFVDVLEDAISYSFNSAGELVFDLGSAKGTAVFK